MRLILDTNLWISFLISSNYEKLDELLFNEKCKLLFSQELLEEFVTVAKRPKLKKYISRDELEDLLETIDEVAEIVNVTPPGPKIRSRQIRLPPEKRPHPPEKCRVRRRTVRL